MSASQLHIRHGVAEVVGVSLEHGAGAEASPGAGRQTLG